MPQCICCGQETPHEQELLEVKTLHIRDVSGESRVQGLGTLVRGSVCDACARKHGEDLLHPGKALILRIAAFLALSLAGGILFFILPELPLKVPCACAVFLGIVCAAGAWITAEKKRSSLAAMAPEQATQALRMELLRASLPKKDKDGATDLTYIEVSPALIESDPMVLAAEHRLMPIIAKQAVERAKERFAPDCSEEDPFERSFGTDAE